MSSSVSRHRQCVVLHGSAEQTACSAARMVRRHPVDGVLWVGGEAPGGVVAVAHSRTGSMLGRAFGAVVLDLYDGLDADVLGQCHGFVWGGGALVLRMPDTDARLIAGNARLAAPPHAARDVGFRFWTRFERSLWQSPATTDEEIGLPVPSQRVRGTPEQAEIVDELAAAWQQPEPGLFVLMSDRGRGKSSALGLAIQRATARVPLRVVVSAADARSADEVCRFAASAGEDALQFVPPLALLSHPGCDVIAIDEAAQLPVPLLRRLVVAHPGAHFAFATTARGYEGTGRGFALRFLEQLKLDPRPLTVRRLDRPIRWDEGDPLERLVFDALCLDAEPVKAELATFESVDDLEHRVLDRDRLVNDEQTLRDFFGLLVHAHYRTTPEDLHRMLDAPNIRLHALLSGGRVVAATWVALEGELPSEVCDVLFSGERRIRGHALPETLVCHSGKRDAGRLSMVRSVRIATHPALRRRGVATKLVEHVHRSHAPDLFGTIFGATAGLLEFRRSVGYELVRVGASRGSRTGEPAAVMMHPVSPPARALFADLRAELSRDLPLHVELLGADGELLLEPELERALFARLPEPAPLTDDERDAIVASYASGPRTYDAASFAISRWVDAHAHLLERLDPASRALVRGRVLERRGWTRVAEAAAYETVPAAMRQLRRAIAELVRVAGEERPPREPSTS